MLRPKSRPWWLGAVALAAKKRLWPRAAHSWYARHDGHEIQVMWLPEQQLYRLFYTAGCVMHTDTKKRLYQFVPGVDAFVRQEAARLGQNDARLRQIL